MIWTPKPDPKVGAMRVVRRFAWLPVELVTGEMLWLQTYYVLRLSRGSPSQRNTGRYHT
jgi:hypothetical protein